MNFAVDWAFNALAGMAAIWLQAADRAAVNAAQVTIDRLLAADPLKYSSPVSEGLHAIEVDPLRALFEVDEANRTVRVVSVNWRR